MTSSWRHFMFLRFENLKFCKTKYKTYLPDKFEISCLSGSNFMEVNVRPPQNTIMTTLWRHFLSLSLQISTFLEHDRGYQPSKFQCSRMSRSNLWKGVNPPPKCYNEIKKPSAHRAKRPAPRTPHPAPRKPPHEACKLHSTKQVKKLEVEY